VEKEEELEWVAGKCSPRLEVKGCGRISSGGGGARRPSRSTRGGGAPVEFLQLEAAEHVRLGVVVPMDLLRTMCGLRTGGWSLPCVMSD
jgi:hypothetical protein